MPRLPFIDADALRASVPIGELLDAVDAAYRDVAARRDRSPLRSQLELGPDGVLLLMPGLREGGSGATVKLVSVVPSNVERSLPTVQALVVWFDAETGRPAALLDGTALTAMRTGAASGVATRLMARADARVLALFGAGGQAEWQLRAVAAARPIGEVRVVTRRPSSREVFASRMSEEMGLDVRPVADPAAALDGADVACCATTSSTPIFAAAAVPAGCHVNGIGSFRPDMVEMPPELLGAADLVAVDSRSAAMAESGEVRVAIERGLLSEERLVELGGLPPDHAATRPASWITVFKSVGLAIQDLAAAELAVRRSVAS